MCSDPHSHHNHNQHFKARLQLLNTPLGRVAQILVKADIQKSILEAGKAAERLLICSQTHSAIK